MASVANKNNLSQIDRDIDQCMIKDRFGFSKALKVKKGTADRLKSQVDKSIRLAESRKQSVPPVHFPPELPVSRRVDEIADLIKKNQVVILTGETGSGKTTQLPKICLKMGLGVFGKIAHTQPRRVAARTVANRIAEELGVTSGEEVGYQIRFDDHTTPKTLVKVMTDGVLLSEIQKDLFLEAYDTIIIDEAHERSLNIDFILGYIKRILPKRPDLKIIVTSATIDVERFSNHFEKAPIVEVSGRTWPVEVLYRPLDDTTSRDSDELIQEAVLDAVKEIESFKEEETGGGILVFLPGEREIRDLAMALRKARTRFDEILPLYSRLSVSEQNKIFSTGASNASGKTSTRRRIVLATNVAETSLTVPGISYVIDPGLARLSRYSVRSRVQQLPVEKVSQASADQRKGRCGRVAAGVCIRLYSEEDFNSRPRYTDPEILRTSLAAVVLQMLVLKLGDIAEFSFVERPPVRQINDAYNLLKELEAVGANKNMTRLGKDLAKIPLDLRLGRMILQAGKENSLFEVLIVASMLSIQDPRERPFDHKKAADEAHKKYTDEQSDFLSLVNLWNIYEEQRQQLTQKKLRAYCRSNFLSFPRMREWREVHRQLALICKEMKLGLNSRPAGYDEIHKAILSGLLGHVGQKVEKSEYLGAHNRKYHIFPGSSQFSRRPKWIMSAELVETTRLYGRMVAEINNEWIERLAPHLIKRFYDEPHFSRKNGQVMAYERILLYGLTIIERRLVDFSHIDPVLARQIFIQSGLVEQQLKTKAKFYIRNNDLIEQVENVESKVRRKDLLVDVDLIYEFYDENLPDEICGQFDLESWLKRADPVVNKRLFMNKDWLIKADRQPFPGTFPDTFPDEVEVEQARLKLDYIFDPQKIDDGVTLTVPLSILRQVPAAQLDWIVPGLLKEKCLALLKTLPKNLRKNFIPAPDIIEKVQDKLVYDGLGLTEALAEQLYRLKGVKISSSDFSEDKLEKYLRLNVRVVDENGKVLAEDRHLKNLVERFQEDFATEFMKKGLHSIEREGICSWDFDTLPEVVEFMQAGVQIKGYPALVDRTDCVDIQVHDTLERASRESKQGCLRLIMLELASQVKYVSKNMHRFNDISLLYATRGKKEKLLEAMVESAFRYTFTEDLPRIMNRSAFDERLENRQELFSIASQLSDLIHQTLQLVHGVEISLDAVSAQMSYLVEDVHSQLDRLLTASFPLDVPLVWLKQYPRYMRAIAMRVEKLQGNFEKDKSSTVEIQSFQERIEPLVSHQLNEDQHQLRWMIEEYRVSLFAQTLGTKIPVSAKRLEKQIAKAGSSF